MTAEPSVATEHKAAARLSVLWRRIKHIPYRVTHSRHSLVGRLIRLAAVWFICVLVIIAALQTAVFHQAALHRFQIGVSKMAYNLYVDTDIDNSGHVLAPILVDPGTDHIYSGVYWQVAELNDKGMLIDAKSRSLWNDRLPLPVAIATALRQQKPGQTLFYDARGPRGQHLRVAVIYTVISGRSLVFMAGENRAPMEQDVEQFALITVIALLVLAAGSLIAIFLQVRVGLRPLFELTDEIANTQRGAQQRLVKDYPAEIRPVAKQINAFLDYSQDVVERQRTHVGNLAHALKTPLSVLLTSAGDDPSPLAQAIRKQTELMRGQVDHHLRRARAAARSQSMGERTPVEPVLDELAVMLEQVFQDKGVVVDWRAPDTLAFRGERADLQEIAGNLLENACIWCTRKVRVTAAFDEEPHLLDLTIEDDGPGLDEARFDDVLKRGARLDETVPGSGLGLSIVDELVRAYGGTLRFDRAPLGGLRVHVRLPGAMGNA